MPEEQELFKAKHRRIQYEPPYTHTADGPQPRGKPKSQLVRDATDTTKTTDPKSHAKKLEKKRADEYVAQRERETAEARGGEETAVAAKPRPRSVVKSTAKKGENK